MKTYGGVIASVQALYKKGIKPGTAVTRGILDRLGCPDAKLKIIHVAGTNGKGSVCEYLTQILLAAGKKTGTFQSPAVYDYCEQFRINGEPLEKGLLEHYLATALAVAGSDATGFETEVAAALYAFEREGCEYAVIECGMGGRDDATNAISRKELAVITSIGLEHTAFLGNTLKEICAHKAEIINNCPAVVSGLQTAEVKSYMRGKGVIFADKEVEITKSGLYGQKFLYGGKPFEINMSGSAQVYNAATAIEAARLLKISETSIYTGLKAAKLPGRLEILKARGTTYVLDGAHNPASFAPLAELLEKELANTVKTVIFGCLSDKDVDGDAKAIARYADRFIAVSPNSSRKMELNKIAAACKKYGNNVSAADGVKSALEMADGDKVVVVCGSFTLLEEAKEWIEKRS